MSQLFCSSGIADEYDERGSSLASPAGRVDSIDSISKKISFLDSELNRFCPENELVIDSYMEKQQTSETNDDEQFGYGNLKIDYKAPKQAPKRGSISTREKEKKELNKFAGVYAMRTVMGKNQDPLNVHSSRLTVDVPKKRNFKESNQNHSTVSKKPMLVELHTFPGFNPDTLTPLPGVLPTRNVLNIVTNAQKDLSRKPGFKKEFKRIFLTHPSQAVVQDLFWWFFLEKYQSCPEIQRQLFSRVACNYVKLVFTAWDQKYKETFFKRFPSLVCQAVYTIFCHVFPTSYRQFDERFRQDLADVVYQWIVGTKPIRRCWERWPLALLEPDGMNKEDEIQKNVSKEFVIGWLDVESGETRRLPENSLSTETVNSKQMKSDRRRSLPKILENNLTYPGGSEVPSVVTREKKIPKKRDGSWLSVTHDRPEHGKTDALNGEKQDSLSNPKLNTSTSLQSTKTSNTSLKRNCKNRESCCAGKGPEFQKVAFDLHGHSPLVQHFLQDRRLARESGMSILVQRTEIEKLPPINAPTYQDVIKESLKSSQELEKQIQSLIEQSSNERIVFGRQQKKEREEFRKKETEVLSRQKEVKKISDLILLQLAKGRNLENDKLIASSIANALKFDEKTSKY